MKRLSCFLVLVVFCLSIFAISVNPSMDGRAVVADAGIFPPGGYYGRAPGYLPGDTVVVTNHNNGFSIDVLILGTYDAYEGIAILLSPEAADKLQIVKGKDVYVKVQKKQPISYEEAVATSRNKKATQSQIVDTDKDSSVLPGQTEQLVNDVIASKNNSEIQDDVLPVEELEPVENETDLSEPVNTEIAESENSEEVNADTETEMSEPEVTLNDENINSEELTDIAESEVVPDEEIIMPEQVTEVTENTTDEVFDEESKEATDLEELAEPEEYVESKSIDSPIFEVAEEVSEIAEEPVTEVFEENPEEKEEVVLDEIQNEDFDESDFIETPVESEIAEITEEEPLPEEENIVEENSEEIAEIEEVPEEDIDDEYIVLDEIPDEQNESEEYQEPIQEELAEVPELETEYVTPEEVLTPEEEVVLEDVSEEETLSEEMDEVLVPEEELAEIPSEEEIISPEILETEAIDDEPELALSDEYIEEPVKSVAENPKDIFSMIVGEELNDDIIEDVVLEEAEPKLPELDDSYTAENDVADLEIKLDEPELKLSEMEVESEPVAVIKNETSDSTAVSSNIDSFEKTVSNFNDLPKVKQTKSKTYYIQIATVNKKENVAKMIDLHGNKYPVYVIKNSAKSSYQVLVGPLNDDEYALVLARFKQIYKDAFLRVLK